MQAVTNRRGIHAYWLSIWLLAARVASAFFFEIVAFAEATQDREKADEAAASNVRRKDKVLPRQVKAS